MPLGIVYTVIGCDSANVMPRTRQIDGSTYGINVIVIPQMLKSSFDSGLCRGTRTFTNTAGRQCPWTSCLIFSYRYFEKIIALIKVILFYPVECHIEFHVPNMFVLSDQLTSCRM